MSGKIGMISLGCPKNQVDAELMLSKLSAAGFDVVDDIDAAELVIINTCAFIEDAKKEAIDSILNTASLKEDGVIQKIVVTGCLSERYRQELVQEFPEVDAVVGIGANADIAEVCARVLSGENVNTFPEKELMPLEGERMLTTPEWWAYLKIADGCSNRCSYCVIPSIRGDFRSRSMESILDEARTLADGGVKELVLIAQDTTRYGEDNYGSLMLPQLLEKLCEIDSLKRIRLLYCYPDRVTDELIKVMASNEKIVHYMDLPLQHASGRILKAMNRSGDAQSLSALIEKLRAAMPDIVLRTTFITGFPGETEEDFEILDRFIQDTKFDRLGCFSYSREEGTPAAGFENQVDKQTADSRADHIMEKQYEIFLHKNEEYIGKTYPVIVEGYDPYTDTYFGRGYMDAPEIDNRMYFTCGYKLNDGDEVEVEVFDMNEYDLIGEVV
ncbi:MAG: 30S ribosomal protein S12 methylthiotransferase RimO [Clostridiales bacterium]|nr:30S ribosomal protein S12 methylthiotransferase RimO [Clostridiales bacterium]